MLCVTVCMLTRPAHAGVRAGVYLLSVRVERQGREALNRETATRDTKKQMQKKQLSHTSFRFAAPPPSPHPTLVPLCPPRACRPDRGRPPPAFLFLKGKPPPSPDLTWQFMPAAAPPPPDLAWAPALKWRNPATGKVRGRERAGGCGRGQRAGGRAGARGRSLQQPPPPARRRRHSPPARRSLPPWVRDGRPPSPPAVTRYGRTAVCAPAGPASAPAVVCCGGRGCTPDRARWGLPPRPVLLLSQARPFPPTTTTG